MVSPDSQKYILVVDDDSTMQLLLQGMIEKTGNRAVIAENGEKALQFLEVGGTNIAAMLLDRNMPDMDGMQVVKKVFADERFDNVPIIMQSGSRDLAEIKEAIDEGVFYYLSKPYQMEALQSVLAFAVQKSALHDGLNGRLSMEYAPGELIRSVSFEFITHEEAQRVAILVAALFPEPHKVFKGLLGLFLNAVEHGNLEIGYEKKAELYNKFKFKEEIARLEGLKKNKSKIVEVQYIHKDGRRSVRITDKGKGFDWKAFTAFKDERDSYMNGYGVIKAYNSFDEIKYNTAGNQVMATVFDK